MVFVSLRRTLAAASIVAAAATAAHAQATDPSAIARQLTAVESQVAAAERRAGSLHVAQLFERPPEDVQGGSPSADGPQAQTQADDPTLRIARLEAKLRDITGRIETAEHDIRRVEDDFKKFKQDVDFRMQDLAAGRAKGRRSDAEESPAVTAAPAPDRAAKRRGDAFDANADPSAPGAPRPLGSVRDADDARPAAGRTATNADDDPTAPLDLTRGATGSIPRRRSTSRADGASANAGLPGSGTAMPDGAAISPGTGGGARAEFDGAIALLRQKQYQTAETNFQTFLQKHPRDRLAADAVYYLGETYALRGRQREAAEQFLKVSTDYVKSSRAPEGMVKLGVSLNALGAKEQACATFDEVSRKFPNASNAVKNSADRESKRAKC